MMSSTAWQVLSTDGTDEVVLLCDFPTPIRPEALFTEFVPLLTPTRTVWEMAIPPWGTEAGWEAADYVEFWSSALRESGVHVAGIVGFCTGNVFAAALIERIAEFQPDRPPFVMLDPELPTELALYAQYHRGVEMIGAALGRDEVEAMHTAGQDLLAGDGGLQEFGPALNALYIRVGEPALARIGLKPARRAEFSSTFTAFVTWVVAADQVVPDAQWARAVCVSSADHDGTVIGAERLITLDTKHDVMLRDPEVARTVLELLDAHVRR
jgi:hypothetical protein